jgi:Flp pilus assembly protein TadB
LRPNPTLSPRRYLLVVGTGSVLVGLGLIALFVLILTSDVRLPNNSPGWTGAILVVAIGVLYLGATFLLARRKVPAGRRSPTVSTSTTTDGDLRPKPQDGVRQYPATQSQPDTAPTRPPRSDRSPLLFPARVSVALFATICVVFAGWAVWSGVTDQVEHTVVSAIIAAIAGCVFLLANQRRKKNGSH